MTLHHHELATALAAGQTPQSRHAPATADAIYATQHSALRLAHLACSDAVFEDCCAIIAAQLQELDATQPCMTSNRMW